MDPPYQGRGGLSPVKRWVEGWRRGWIYQREETQTARCEGVSARWSRWLNSLLERNEALQESQSSRATDGLRPVFHIEFAIDVIDVRLDGAHGDDQLPGDLPI